MITFFTSAKPFRGVTAIQQRNALQSWRRLAPDVEVFLFGRDDGTDEVAAELGLRHIPDVDTTEFGTPRLDAMYRQVQAEAGNPIVCYINADIILLPDFVRAVTAVSAWRRPFVLVGHRWDLDFEEPIAFDDSAGWAERIASGARARGHRSHSCALDFFVFPRGAVPRMPGFAIGRPAWDNWLIMDFERRGIPIVDATADMLAIHQNHGYGHVPKARGSVWEGPEADANRRLAFADTPDFQPHLHTIHNAGWLLRGGRVRPAITVEHLSWRLKGWTERHPLPRRVWSAGRLGAALSGQALFGLGLMARRPRTGWRFCRRKTYRLFRRAAGSGGAPVPTRR
jgi:hypothetical protein